MGSRKKTHEEYVAELAIKNPNVEVVGEYDGAHTKIMHHCLIHDVYWKIQPSNALSGNGCPMCRGYKNHVSQCKTHEQYVNELVNINPNIVVIDEYVNGNTPILHKCLLCEYEWRAKPSLVLLGTGCPKCAGILKKTHEQYLEDVSILNPYIEVIEEYINACTPILHRCKIDGNEWMAQPTNILSGKGCPVCAAKRRREASLKTHAQYVEELGAVNPNIAVIGRYINARTPILHRCLIDGHEWLADPDKLLHGHGCPKCNETNGERTVRLWLERHDILYECQKHFDDCRDVLTLPFDFYLPEYNALIEYDGKQHHEPIEYFGGKEAFEYVKRHDEIKNKYCEDNDIRLLRIPYYEDIDEQLNNFLFT